MKTTMIPILAAVLVAMFYIFRVDATTSGSKGSVINCAACSYVEMQMESWECQVNFHVIRRENGKSTIYLLLAIFNTVTS